MKKQTTIEEIVEEAITEYGDRLVLGKKTDFHIPSFYAKKIVDSLAQKVEKMKKEKDKPSGDKYADLFYGGVVEGHNLAIESVLQLIRERGRE